MLSLRLKTIAEMIPETRRLIDVGCDHALLDIYLAKKYPEMQFIATDVNYNALSAAINNIKNNDLENQISTKLTDGLTDIDLNDDDYIVISGMGTKTIIHILENQLDKTNNIIIQSNNDLENLRLFMFQHNFKIANEKIVFDKKYYILIKFIKGKHNYQNEDLWLGPFVKESGNITYFNYILGYYQELIKTIPIDTDKYQAYQARIEYLNQLIEKK